jgi:hypothetical protein
LIVRVEVGGMELVARQEEIDSGVTGAISVVRWYGGTGLDGTGRSAVDQEPVSSTFPGGKPLR